MATKIRFFWKTVWVWCFFLNVCVGSQVVWFGESFAKTQ